MLQLEEAGRGKAHSVRFLLHARFRMTYVLLGKIGYNLPVNAIFRLQLVVPFYTDMGYTMLQNCQNTFIPTFWINLHIDMKDYARNYLHLVAAILPKIVLGFGIGLTALSIIGGGLVLFCIVREKKTTEEKNKVDEDYIGPEKGDQWN